MQRIELKHEDTPVDILAREEWVLVGCTSGRIHAYRYEKDTFTLAWTERVHKRGLRQLAWWDAQTVLSGSVKGELVLVTLVDGTVRKLTQLEEQGERVPISRLCLLDDQHERIAIGDEIGNVYVFTLAADNKLVFKWEEHDDFISGLQVVVQRKTLLASSGDGSLTVMDLKRGKLVAHSASFDDEILSLAVDHDQLVLCGTGQGAINGFAWGYWGAVQERLKPKLFGRQAINAICATAGGNLLLVGTEDGTLRSLAGRQTISVLGQLPDAIEVIRVEDQRIFVGCTGEPAIFIFDLPKIALKDSDEADESGQSDSSCLEEPASKRPNKNDFLRDLD